MSHALGDAVEAFCGKCELVTAHNVVRLSGTRVSRVACVTCKDEHAYRKTPPKGTKQDPEALKAAQARRKASKAASAYDAAMGEVDPDEVVPYTFASRFEANDVIEHQAFGVGRVVRILSGNKMEVVFKASSKILMHGVASISG